MKLIKSFLTRIKGFGLNSLISDSFWSLSGNIVGKGLALLGGVFIARFLGKDVYGEFGIIKNTILTIAIFSTYGLGYTSTKFVADLDSQNSIKTILAVKYANVITIIFSVFSAFFLFVFAEYFSQMWLKAPNLSGFLKLFSGVIVFHALSITQVGILSGFGQFRSIAKVNVVVGILTFVLSVGLTYFYSLYGALIAFLIAQVLNCIFNFFIIKDLVKPIETLKTNDYELLKKIMIFSLPITLQECLYAFSSWIFLFLLIKFSDFGEIGLYTASMQWSGVILFIPGVLRNVALTYLSKSKNELDSGSNTFSTLLKISIVSTVVPIIVVIMFSDYIINLYGVSFDGMKEVLRISVITTVFHAIANIYAQLYMARNMNWIMLLVVTVKTLLIIGIYMYYTIIFNESGAGILAWSILIAMILTVIALHLIFKFKKSN